MQVTFPKTVVYKTEGRNPSRGEADGQMDRGMRTPNFRQNEFKHLNAMGSSPQRRNNFGTTSGSPRSNFISQPQSHPLGNKGGYLLMAYFLRWLFFKILQCSVLLRKDDSNGLYESKNSSNFVKYAFL